MNSDGVAVVNGLSVNPGGGAGEFELAGDDLLGEVALADEVRDDVDFVRVDHVESLAHGRFFFPKAAMNLGEEASFSDFVGVVEVRSGGIRVLGGAMTHDEKRGARLGWEIHGRRVVSLAPSASGSVNGGVTFEKLLVWHDGQARTGPENMAIDEALYRMGSELPILRIYRWEEGWGSLGYFQSLAEAREVLGSEVSLVRRWTGGGVVDHRGDETYTVIVPPGEALFRDRRKESYCEIHGTVSLCLADQGVETFLSGDDAVTESVSCFEKPVTSDLLKDHGAKVAGAGQKRGREGILHQGSVRAEGVRLENLGKFLAHAVEEVEVIEGIGHEKLIERYAAEEWLNKKQ